MTKLQRYKLHGECGSYYEFFKHPNGDWVKDSDVAELESALCETCKDPVCEDSQLGYWILKAQRYEKVLREIREHKCGNCGAQNMADDALEEK